MRGKTEGTSLIIKGMVRKRSAPGVLALDLMQHILFRDPFSIARTGLSAIDQRCSY